MASGFLSRLLPVRSGSPSVYETIRQQEDDEESSDYEGRIALAIDEQNLGENFHDLDLEAARFDLSESHATARSNLQPPLEAKNDQSQQIRQSKPSRRGGRSRGRKASRLLDVEEADDEVPASLLVEGGGGGLNLGDVDLAGLPPRPEEEENPAIPAIRSPRATSTRQQWKATRARQRLHSDSETPSEIPSMKPLRSLPGLAMAHPKEKAMWRWANVENLDNFIQEVYVYYLGNGVWSILLNRCLNLLTLAFVVGFSIFLLNCVDYRSLPQSSKLSEVVIPQCTKKMSSWASFLLWLFCFVWIGKLFQWVLEIRPLFIMQAFFHHLLGVSDVDIQTISWQEIISRLMELRDSNPATAPSISARHRKFLGGQSKQRMDAHDIANRLMRKENYLIALYNKDVLNLTLPIRGLKNRQLFSRTLEWNINLCVLDYVFNEQGQVKKAFLKREHRKVLSDGLRRRFLFAGFMNIFIAPFIVVYFLMHYFFRYFNEFQKNPSQIGSRQYNPLAQWKFREFNELWHLFQKRMNMSYPFAARYVNQFPKDKTDQICRFIAFVSGAIASVLALASVLDPELFLNFEITPNRTVLFYISVFGAIWAATHGILPEDNVVFDPEQALHDLTTFTRYCPAHWEGRFHSDEVRQEFARLYQLKVVIFMEEILSMIFTPFVLWFSLPKCSERLIDFFREFTVDVDGLGHVCSFAVFDFERMGHALPQNSKQPESGEQQQDPPVLRDFLSTKDNKLEASYWGFMNDYALNPKTGIPFYSPPLSRQRYQPPPFPAPMSPSFMADVAGRRDRWGRSRQTSSLAMGLTGGAAEEHAGSEEPITSVLLDRHHQPATRGSRTTGPDTNTQSRFRSARRAPRMAKTAEAEEDAISASNLGESWKAEQAAEPDQEDEDGGDDQEKLTSGDTGAGAGVLGIIKNFQMGRNDGRGTGGLGL
ncbi:MAG: hypothetical protein Q9227_006813 [Pyrenula ochraceoflavens]